MVSFLFGYLAKTRGWSFRKSSETSTLHLPSPPGASEPNDEMPASVRFAVHRALGPDGQENPLIWTPPLSVARFPFSAWTPRNVIGEDGVPLWLALSETEVYIAGCSHTVTGDSADCAAAAASLAARRMVANGFDSEPGPESLPFTGSTQNSGPAVLDAATNASNRSDDTDDMTVRQVGYKSRGRPEPNSSALFRGDPSPAGPDDSESACPSRRARMWWYYAAAAGAGVLLVRLKAPAIYDTLIIRMTSLWYRSVFEQLKPGTRLLDIGIGTATALIANQDEAKRKRLSVVGVDYDASYIAAARTSLAKSKLADQVQVYCKSVYDEDLAGVVEGELRRCALATIRAF